MNTKLVSSLLSGLILLCMVFQTLSDMDMCANEVQQLYRNENGILLHSTQNLLEAYNSTCLQKELCKFDMDEATASYIINSDLTTTPDIPDHPLEGKFLIEMDGFQTDTRYQEYVKACSKVGGKVCETNIVVQLVGNALDIVDVDFDVEVLHFPMCLVDVCDDEDLELVVEGAIKKYFIASESTSLTKQQQQVVSSLSLDMLCAGSGLQECEFSITDVGCAGGFDFTKPQMSASSSSSQLYVATKGFWTAVVTISFLIF